MQAKQKFSQSWELRNFVYRVNKERKLRAFWRIFESVESSFGRRFEVGGGAFELSEFFVGLEKEVAP